MKITAQRLAAAAMAACLLIGGAPAWADAPSLSNDSLRTDTGRIMMDVSTYAGLGDDGSGSAARLYATFRSPSGLLVQLDGILLVADTKNHLLRRIAGDSVSTYAGLIAWKDGKGSPLGARLDGTADLSVFQEPMGLASDRGGSIYVADAGNHAIRKVDASGRVTTIAGSGQIGLKDGQGLEAAFDHPQDVAVASDGTVYVADTLNHVIRRISPDGRTTTLTAPSSRLVEVTPGQVVPSGDFRDGSIAEAKFNEPSGLALDDQGNLYISDSGNQRIRYMDFGKGQVMTVAGGSAAAGAAYEPASLYAQGAYADGKAGAARFNFPQGIALTPEGGLVIADSMNHSIRYLLDGEVTTLAGDPRQRTGEADGTERTAQFQKPMDVAAAADGSIYAADAFNNKVRRLTPYQLPTGLPQNDEVKVVLGSTPISFEVQPEIVNGRTMVPVRAVTEALGYKVEYKEEDRSVQLTKGDVTVVLHIGQTGIEKQVKGQPGTVKATDTAPYIKDGNTYVPVRFFAEETGLDVQWEETARAVVLRPLTKLGE
ncbi:stalk domain-containing protein [Paenibacillus sp. TAB 01]|uniref:stalk domain-containing protein n=1 Tax=Paenibacillus sp. TAB 01 TaxID=3368988 RepID=UPI003753B24C